MLGLIALLISIIIAVGGHISSRNFTSRRLRFTRVAERPGISGVLAGVGVGVLAAPLMAILPLVGAGTAMLLGAGVGTGVALGARAPAHDPSY
jgi:hypothetical protein